MVDAAVAVQNVFHGFAPGDRRLRIVPAEVSWVALASRFWASGFMRLFLVEDHVRSGDGARGGWGDARMIRVRPLY